MRLALDLFATPPADLAVPGRRWKMRLVLWGGAVAVGIVSVAFCMGCRAGHAAFPSSLLFNPFVALGPTPAGFVFCAWAARALFPGAQGSGIPQAIAARRHLKDSPARKRVLLSLRLMVGKVLLTLVWL